MLRWMLKIVKYSESDANVIVIFRFKLGSEGQAITIGVSKDMTSFLISVSDFVAKYLR